MTPTPVYPFDTPPAEAAAIRVATGIVWLRLPLPMALDHVNCYALDDGDSWTLVDTGLAGPVGKALWHRMLAGPLRGKPVARLIVTHHHPDHIGLAGWFQAQGVELVTTRTAWLYARMLTLDVQALPSPQQLAFYQRAGLAADLRIRKANERPFNFCDVVDPMPLGFTRIDEGHILAAGGRRWQVRLGQGHAPDHATLWSIDDAVILGGDQVLPRISPNIGVYATEPGADPLGEFLTSTTRFMNHANAEHLVLPGHQLPFRGLPDRLVQMVAHHETALTRLRDHLATPRLAVDCFAPLFRREIGPADLGLALAETLAHLNHLLVQGAVTRALSADGAWIWQAQG